EANGGSRRHAPASKLYGRARRHSASQTRVNALMDPPYEATMLDTSTPLIFFQLGPLYQALAPWSEALLRVAVGLALVPHGLRMTFGLFPNTGLPVRNLATLSAQLDRDGYRPGRFWAPAISLTQLAAGPLLALGLLSRLAAIPIVIFLIVSNVER